jgi:4-carboxymuconolactone decarboxylase
MARMKGVEPHEAGWLTRLIYWMVKRKIGKLTGQQRLVESVKIAAHHPRLLKALGQMEMGQEAARSVPAALKSLASIKAATLVGCPY